MIGIFISRRGRIVLDITTGVDSNGMDCIVHC